MLMNASTRGIIVALAAALPVHVLLILGNGQGPGKVFGTS
jgi:hypothetical protein